MPSARILPTPTLRAIARRSRLLFHWTARDFSLRARTGQVAAFTRAGGGGLIADQNGVFYKPVHSQPRFEACDWDGTGILDDVLLLVEPQGTNLLKSSEDVSNATYWPGVAGTPTRVAGVVVAGELSLDRITDNDGAVNERYEQPIAGGTFSGTNPIYLSVFVKEDGAESANGPGIALWDSTAGVERARISWTFDASGVPIVAVGAGTLVGSRHYGGGIYRLVVRATGVVNANNHLVQVFCCYQTAEQGSAVMNCYQLEQGTGPSTYVKTTSATVAHLSETVSFPINFPPPPSGAVMTFYVRAIDRFSRETNNGGGTNISARIVEIGNSTVRMIIFHSTSGTRITGHMQWDGSSTKTVIPVVTLTGEGDRIEFRLTVRADGTVFAEARINGGAIASAGPSTAFAGPYPSAWIAPNLCFAGENGGANSRVGVLEVKAAVGELTLTEMAEAQ